MLAQNFLGAEALGISDPEFESLIKVLGMLERRELTHLVNFNMQSWCGTACCIGGWAEKVGDLLPDTLSIHSTDQLMGGKSGLYDLFYPDEDNKTSMAYRDMKHITTGQAAIALRNYLTTGEPRWAEAVEVA